MLNNYWQDMRIMDTSEISRYLDRTIKFASLATVLLVPLAMPAFQPELDYAYGEYKSFILHIAALLIASCLTGGLLITVIREFRVFDRSKDKFLRFVKNSHSAPAGVLVVGMLSLVVAFGISTLMSPLPLVSFFGVYEEFNGLNFYDFISLTIVFFGIAFKFRNVADLKLLIITLSLAGALTAFYGLVQHFGWDALGGRHLRAGEDWGVFARSPSSFGNNLNFSAFLILTTIATLSIVSITRLDRYGICPVVIALGMQLSALWLGGSRGCYLGALMGVSALVVFVGLAYGWRGFLRILLILTLGVFVAIIITSRPVLGGIDPLSKVASIGDHIEVIGGAEREADSFECYDSPGFECSKEGGLYTRSRIWTAAIKLLNEPVVPQEEFALKTELRRIYGLGPDMFVHSYPIAVSPIGFMEIQPSVHNILLHIVVATGILGFIGLLIIAYGIVIVTVTLIKRLRQDVGKQPMMLFAAVLMSMLFGKIVEMQVGVSRVSDLLPTFAVFGGLVASVSLVKYRAGQPAQISSIDSQKRVGFGVFNNGLPIAGVAILSLVLFIVIFVGWDLRRLGGSLAIAGVSQSEDPVAAGQQFLESNRRAPDRQHIAQRIYEVYVNEAWVAHTNGQREQAILLMMKAREVWLPLEARNPYELGAQLALAKTAATLVSWGRVEFVDEVRFRYEKIARTNPGLPILVETASKSLASIGDYEMAINLADQVIATEDQTHGWSKAWYAKGASKFLLGYEKEGIADLLVATEKQPRSEGAARAHSTLAKIYRDRGDIESAEFHEHMASQ
jgi:hypothetical protein